MSSGGGGGGSNDVADRLTRLETDLKSGLSDLRSEMRLLLTGGIGGCILLFGATLSSHVMLRGEFKVEIDSLRAKDDAIIAMVQSKHEAVIERLSKLETTVAVILTKLEDREAPQTAAQSDKHDGGSSSPRRDALH